MSARSSNRRRRSGSSRTPRRTEHGRLARRQPGIVTECIGWGLFAALVVPAALILTGGGVRTAVIAGVGTAGLTAVLYVTARLMRIALPHLDGESGSVETLPPVDAEDLPPGPLPFDDREPALPPIPPARGQVNEHGIPLSPPYGYEPARFPQAPPYGQERPPAPQPPGHYAEPFEELDIDWDPDWDSFDRPSSGSRRGPRHRAP